jgi:hypothetical protein
LNTKFLNLLLLAVALLLTITIAHSLSGADFGAADVPLRYLGALAAVVAMGVVAYFTWASSAWLVSMRELINGAAGAMLYAVFLWLFSGAMFAIPAVGDLGLRPAVVFPILFGYLFGPITGFVAGGFGSVFGNLLAGLPIAPEWEMAGALAGFVTGLRLVFPDRPRTMDIATGIIAAIGVLAAAVYLLNPALSNQFAGGPMTPWLGYSVPGGVILCLAIRYAFADLEWSKAVVWGALGSLAGLGLAAISDLWVDASQLGAAGASAGRFIPAAGPSLIALILLLPILMVTYEAMQADQAA